MANKNRGFRSAMLKLIADRFGVSLQVHLIPWRWILPMTWQVETQRLMTFTPKRFSTSVPAPTAVRSTMHQQEDSH